MITNTAPFDITHHPAMAVRCDMADGLPVSVMLVSRHWDEPAIYRAAYAFEGTADHLLARGSVGNSSTLRQRAPDLRVPSP